jgi:hypothetical protein
MGRFAVALMFALLFAPGSAFSADSEFVGLKFGVGLSLTVDTGTQDRVESAEVVDGIVRVSKENDTTARIILESHYFFSSTTSPLLGAAAGDWGVGPFVALQPGSDEIIEAIGLGVMVGFRRAGDGVESWNLGVGIMVDPNVRVLGDGLNENEPLPGAETTVRFKEKSQVGVLVMTSFTF